MRRKKQRLSKQAFPKVTLHKLDWLEWTSIVLCLWFWFYPHPYKLAFGLVLSLPIIGLILNGLSRPNLASLVSISSQQGKGKYDLADFIEFPGIVILIRMCFDFEFESFYSIIKVGSIAFILLLLILFITHKLVDKTNPNKSLIYLTIIGNIAIYSYAATYGINCVFDESEPKVYQAKVIEKSISRGRRHTTYHLRVEPWGHHHDAENITVAESQYTETEIGQTVSIDYKEGLLNIPWYYIEKGSTTLSNDYPNDKYTINVKLIMPGNDSTGGLISIKKNGLPYKAIHSEGIEYPVSLDFNENYLIKCSKKGFTTKSVYFDTHVPKGREKERFADFLVKVNLYEEGKGEQTNPEIPIGGVKYNTETKDFRKVK